MTNNLDLSGPKIPEFYAGRTLFMTGGSGFMGKVLVVRLLTTCPQIKKIYLLMREKSGLSPAIRLQQLKMSQVFEPLRATDPRQLDKIDVISGDVTLQYLGVSAADMALMEDVTIVFHIAATVKLQEGLARSVNQNLKSVMNSLELCDALPKIDAFLYISTAYSNAELPTVEEKVYPPPMALEKLLKLVESRDIIEDEAQTITAPKPNTYTFTKAMSEHVVEQHGCQRYPVAIFRPSIVISSIQHPFPGWIENLNGPSGVISAASAGLLTVMRARDDARADMVPVDLAVDCLAVAAYETAIDRSPEVRVYNCTSNEQAITWGRVKLLINKNLKLYPSGNAVMYPHIVVSQNKYIYKILQLIFQTLPLHLIHYVTRLAGIKSINLIKADQKLKAMNRVSEYFATNDWTFKTDNIDRMRRRMTEQDRALFNVDTRKIEWNQLFDDFARGTRKHILKEKETNLMEARSLIKRMAFYLLRNYVRCNFKKIC